MKSRYNKWYLLAGIILCCVMLISMVPIHAFADENTTEPVAYQKITDKSELVAGNTYVITYTDDSGTVYALSTDSESNYTKVVTANGDTLMVDPSGDYVLALNSVQDNGTFKFADAKQTVGLKISTSDPFFVDGAGKASELTLSFGAGKWAIVGGKGLDFSDNRFIAGANKTEYVKFDIWTPVPALPSTTDYVKIVSLDQLADFDTDTEFVLVLETKDGLRAMGSGSTWLYPLAGYSEDKGVYGSEYISVYDADPVVLKLHSKAQPISGTINKIRYWGIDEYGIALKGTSNYFYPQGAGNSSSPFRNREYTPGGQYNYNNTVRFEYGTDENGKQKIYVRGNGESTYLGYDSNGNFTGRLSQDGKLPKVDDLPQESGERIPVQIYVAVPEESERISIEYYDENGNVNTISYAKAGQGKITLASKIENKEYNGYIYSLVGWTMTKPENTFLSLDDSCNIFDYDPSEGVKRGRILQKIQDEYDLIGECNPDLPTTLDLSTVSGGETIKLYPVYAVRGFDKVVTADDGGMRIVGVTDWKSDPAQGLANYYFDAEREKWLGYIDVQIFKDGIEWTNTRMYYRYHNDDTADLSIKFIVDGLVDCFEESEDMPDPLYQYMNTFEDDYFPDYDQSGHFIIDAVIAKQGGSEDGLLYRLNWMTDHGGRLDNVAGKSTVQIFVTTKYNVKYYLDDDYLGDGEYQGNAITGNAWLTDGHFSTPGTENLFNEFDKNTQIKVRQDSEDTVYGLMMRQEFTEEDMGKPDGERWDVTGKFEYDQSFRDGEVRAEPEIFSYFMHDSRHAIQLAKSPEELVADGYALISKFWDFKDESMTKRSTFDWSELFTLDGTEHGTGNTIGSYKDMARAYEVSQASADTPYTFHLYAYSAVPGNLTVSKTVTGDGGDTNKAFTFTVKAGAYGNYGLLNGTFGDMEFVDGVATFTLKSGESKTAKDIPAGITYEVTEAEANKDGYTTTSTGEKGTIPTRDTAVAKFTNDKAGEKKPEPEEKPWVAPPTGDNNHLGLWIMLAVMSMFGIVFIMLNRRRSTNTKDSRIK